MSHAKERKEKSCLNCNAVVEDRYCSVCGQENLEPQETAGHLIGHFFNDITHFDGKFFSSMKYLLTKPGFLSKEYVAGRRASYLNPVRMYVFTSFIFFLIFFSFVSKGKNEMVKINEKDSDTTAIAHILKDSTNESYNDDYDYEKDTAVAGNKKKNSGFSSSLFASLGNYRDRKEYDSLLDVGKIHDDFFERAFVRKKLSLKERYGDDSEIMGEKLNESLFHSIPQMFFISLPLFALFLRLIYIRRKKYYYVAHAIFTIHLYIAIYILVLIVFLNRSLSTIPHLNWIRHLNILVGAYIVYYGYKAMRNFYEQSRIKTLLKYLLIFFWLIFLITFVLVVMFAFSVYKL